MTSDKTATQTADRLLSEHWSASSYVRELQNEQAAAQNILFILQDQELRKLEPLIKVRLLLAPLFLRKQERDNLKDSLQVLADKLCLDDDDWVKVTAYAVGRYEGHLALAGVVKASNAVQTTLSNLQAGLSAAPSTSYRPLEELYLSKQNAARAGGQQAPTSHTHFALRAGAEATARQLSLPALPVRRSMSPAPEVLPSSSAAGPAPKDATERRSMQSGITAVPGRGGSVAGSSSRGGSSGSGSMFMTARPPSRPTSAAGKGSSVRRAPQGKTAKVLDKAEAINLRNKAERIQSQRPDSRRPPAQRLPPSSPLPSAPSPAPSPAADSGSQAIWSPDTPEYIPQYTCQYDDDDDSAAQEAAEMQLDVREGQKTPIQAASGQTAAAGLQATPGRESSSHKPVAYGSASKAPFARRTGP